MRQRAAPSQHSNHVNCISEVCMFVLLQAGKPAAKTNTGKIE